MFRVKSTINYRPFAVKTSRHGLATPIDDFGVQSFNLGSHGWPINDMQAIYKATTMQEVQMILNTISERDSNSLPADVKNVDAIMGIRSRYMQSPLELVMFDKYQYERNLTTTLSVKADKPVEKPVEQPATE